jgi:HAD superfamily hydrolase (TIGR01549 family)
MTIQAVFFDWVNTLVRMEPDRHVLSAQICREFGIDVSNRDILRGIYAADSERTAGQPLRWSMDDDPEVYLDYNRRVLIAAGVTPPDRRTSGAMLKTFVERFKDIRFVLFEDVRPALRELKRRGLATGVISNMPQPMAPILQKLGLSDLLDFAVTPLDVDGQSKPAAPIFLEALTRAGAKPENSVYVGDEFFVDGKGARGVGMTPVILDRYELFESLEGYHRIVSLMELPGLLDSLG